MFRLGTELISDDRRGTAEVNSKKLAQLMMANRPYLLKQGGSQELHVCLLRTEGNHMV
jgi:hypothetical protein